ncbi:MAG: hypothetical protein ACI8ZF_000282 [Candidatus Midichloriaceae bacterium]|jgi:hypothetical protein
MVIGKENNRYSNIIDDEDIADNKFGPKHSDNEPAIESNQFNKNNLAESLRNLNLGSINFSEDNKEVIQKVEELIKQVESSDKAHEFQEQLLNIFQSRGFFDGLGEGETQLGKIAEITDQLIDIRENYNKLIEREEGRGSEEYQKEKGVELEDQLVNKSIDIEYKQDELYRTESDLSKSQEKLNLSNDIQELTTQKDVLKNTITNQQKNVKDLEDKFVQLESKVDEKQGELNKLEESNIEAKEYYDAEKEYEINNQKNEIERLNQIIKSHEPNEYKGRDNSELLEKNKGLTEENKRLQEASRNDNQDEKLQKLQKENENLNLKLQELEGNLEELKSSVDKGGDDIDSDSEFGDDFEEINLDNSDNNVGDETVLKKDFDEMKSGYEEQIDKLKEAIKKDKELDQINIGEFFEPFENQLNEEKIDALERGNVDKDKNILNLKKENFEKENIVSDKDKIIQELKNQIKNYKEKTGEQINSKLDRKKNTPVFEYLNNVQNIEKPNIDKISEDLTADIFNEVSKDEKIGLLEESLSVLKDQLDQEREKNVKLEKKQVTRNQIELGNNTENNKNNTDRNINTESLNKSTGTGSGKDYEYYEPNKKNDKQTQTTDVNDTEKGYEYYNTSDKKSKSVGTETINDDNKDIQTDQINLTETNKTIGTDVEKEENINKEYSISPPTLYRKVMEREINKTLDSIEDKSIHLNNKLAYALREHNFPQSFSKSVHKNYIEEREDLAKEVNKEILKNPLKSETKDNVESFELTSDLYLKITSKDKKLSFNLDEIVEKKGTCCISVPRVNEKGNIIDAFDIIEFKDGKITDAVFSSKGKTQIDDKDIKKIIDIKGKKEISAEKNTHVSAINEQRTNVSNTISH